ncbi:PREDICTED: hyaluronidase A-like [Nicrophorus vespilloides]|uniref:Hyaluronidase n=1 Tax=Nicrophorus vespilloides TaxID=110193 RepID=A0ABM1NAE7_NICVS|nr:PREDICTED: hyaluronidase A-like [Nicrophorus vespilloides]
MYKRKALARETYFISTFDAQILRIMLFFPLLPFLLSTFSSTAHCLNIIQKIEIPSKPFTVYWNSPTFQCKSHKIYFEDLLNKFRIVQNKNGEFIGEKITILYDPGNFPAILTDQNGKQFLRNGGVPQEGNLTDHLNHFEERIYRDFPDEDFNGIAIIDFESWRPIYRQNWAALEPYKNLSVEIERQKHPSWNNAQLIKEATRRFETAGREYVEQTLLFAKSLRPNGTWGYYAYPYCFNMGTSNLVRDCSKEIQKENDRMNWLFGNTDNLYPSLYMPQNRLNAKQRVQMIEGRITESQRINEVFDERKQILPYFWYMYQDTKQFLSLEDLRNSFIVLKSFNIDGVIIWGSSNDVNSKEKCQRLYNYIEKVLGPTINST